MRVSVKNFGDRHIRIKEHNGAEIIVAKVDLAVLIEKLEKYRMTPENSKWSYCLHCDEEMPHIRIDKDAVCVECGGVKLYK